MNTQAAESPVLSIESKLVMRHGFYAVGSAATRFALWTARGAVEAQGLEHVDTSEPTIIAPVHQSGWDIPAVGGEMPMHFIAKRELAKPGFGVLLKLLGGIMIERGSEMSDENKRDAAQAFNNRVPVCIFPQGTRTELVDNEVSFSSLKPGVAVLALENGAQINPVGIAGTTKADGKGPVIVVYGPAITVDQMSPRDTIRSKYRKPLMEELHAGLQDAQYKAAARRLQLIDR